jgi:hypothetical protein
VIFPLALVGSIVVGIVALMKRRNAAAWGISALLLMVVCWWFLDQLMAVAAPSQYLDPNFRMAIVLAGAGVGVIAVLTILIVMPTRPKPPEQLIEDRVPCPICAEMIMRAAVKCRFCGADLVPVEAHSKALEGRFDQG